MRNNTHDLDRLLHESLSSDEQLDPAYIHRIKNRVPVDEGKGLRRKKLRLSFAAFTVVIASISIPS